MIPSQNNQSKMNWRSVSSGRKPALQVQSLEFSSPNKKTKTKKKEKEQKYRSLISE
jgi:hypothetical protein